MHYIAIMKWEVSHSKKSAKQIKQLPEKIFDALMTLEAEIEISGPIRGNWPNYSKLGKDQYHCHLSYKYVACWKVIDKRVQLVEVYYVGGRENAPY
jgi:mRNA-degrading endonuclease RelE of RelBE toxin-antitoxin system